MGKLNDKIALISGAAMGMGAAHARAFVSEWARVILGDIVEQEGSRLAKELGSAATFVTLDVTDPSSWAQALSIAKERLGPVNVLVDNAGVAGPFARTADLSPDAYRHVDWSCFWSPTMPLTSPARRLLPMEECSHTDERSAVENDRS